MRVTMKILTLTFVLAGFCFILLSTGFAQNTKTEAKGMDEKSIEQLLQVEKDFQQAIVENNVEGISRFIAQDWIIVDADGGIIDKDEFLSVIQSGALTHDAMKLEEARVRIYGDTGLVTGRATSAGKYMGVGFTTMERSTDVFLKFGDQWRCVLTHLTRLAAGGTSNAK